MLLKKERLNGFNSSPTRSNQYTDSCLPLTVTETCLPCHTEQGYEVGDIRGGISVSIPADDYISTTMSETMNIWMTYSGIWFVGLLGMVAYFFQNRKTERKITSQLMFQQTLLDCMPTPVFHKDTGGRYIDCNKTFESFLGIDKKDIIGKTVYQISPSEAAKKYHEQDTTLINNGGSQVYEHYVETKDKGRREVIFSKAVFQDSTGRSAGIVGVITDITDRRRLEQNLKRTANEFETIFDNTSMAIVYLKGDRTIHRINKQFSRLFGYDQDEIEGKSVEIIHLSHELFLEFGEKCYPLLKEETVVQVEYQLKTKAGKMIWGNLFGKAVNPPHLEDGIIWIFEDITERKELEKLKADVDLIMIHDLRSPIAGIISAAKLLLMEETTKEEQRTLITELERSAYRLLSRINLSLDLYRMEMGNYEYKPKQLDLINILNQVKQNLTELISSKDMRIVTLFDGRTAKGDSTFMVAADELLIPTMLTNIIQNAVEASPMGGIVTVDMTKEAEFNSITVNNPGVVPEPMRDNFFDKYATHGKPKGTGLGTYSAKLMTETMGGSISMVTDEKEGTTISVTLPA